MTNSGTILAIDDTRATLKILTTLLRGEGYQVHTAENGELALAAVAADPPELILLDIEMPGIDGFEVLRQLRGQEKSCEIPVIFLSAHTEPELRTQGLKLGAVDFISKPYHREELHARVHTHLELSRSRARIALQAAALHRANEQLRLDIAERERSEAARLTMEARLHLAQKLESVGRLAAGIAHQINTPTQFIADNSRFLALSFQQLERFFATAQALRAKAATAPALAASATELAGIETEVELDYLRGEIPRTLEQSLVGLAQITRIVTALKEFAYPPSHETQRSDLNRAIENAIAVTSHEWQAVAEFTTEFTLQLPEVPVFADELNQALLNLIENAAHAIAAALPQRHAAKGRITARTRATPDHAVIEIEDTGTGLPAEALPHLFEPFFTTQGLGVAAGQGLHIVHNIVRRHGGHIEYDTAPDRGTTFRLFFPLVPTLGGAGPTPASSNPPGGAGFIPARPSPPAAPPPPPP